MFFFLPNYYPACLGVLCLLLFPLGTEQRRGGRETRRAQSFYVRNIAEGGERKAEEVDGEISDVEM